MNRVNSNYQGQQDLFQRTDTLAKLGGYLGRNRDAPPGNMVLWRGIARLTDIHLGFCLARDVGN
ncbi:MAG: hypothetical protein ACKO85_22205 [Isosphaeraceae bacterium]